ncbi:PREDICTED: LOC110747193 partial [Prunus dulcis]|uniref:PREDICTED: LOC110747193 partial n=1 Tax=Prunus dulcis TaxID=3755 RepID=A0A5E4GM40_PRUDU|nr:PREDICTED: LOC110747193 partial [Prunus dulcis]
MGCQNSCGGLLLQAGEKGGLWGGIATVMETEAIPEAMAACISSDLNKVEVEADATEIIQMIRGERRADTEMEAIVFDMQLLATEFQQVVFLHTSQRCNKAAQLHAAFVTRYGGNNACFIRQYMFVCKY